MRRRRGLRIVVVGLVAALAVGASSGLAAARGPSDGAHAAVGADKKPKKAKKAKKKATTTANVPADACTLLTDAEVATLVPSSGPGVPEEESAGGVTQVRCEWSTTVPPAGSVTLMLIPLKGTNLQLAKASLQQAEGEEVPGLGDLAVVTTQSVDSEVQALMGNVLLSVDYNALGAGDRASDVVTLARAAAGRL